MLLDVSVPVTPRTAAWPGDVAFSCGWSAQMASGSSVNVGWARSSPHVGTHVDAPFHVDDAGARVGGLGLDAFVGPCVVVDAVGASVVDARMLSRFDLRAAPRVLLHTQRVSEPERFVDSFPLLSEDAVALLRESRVRLVGIDAPSFDAVDSKTLPIHRALGAAGIANVENLALAGVEEGVYELLAAPVRWDEMDAAPLRAIVRR